MVVKDSVGIDARDRAFPQLPYSVNAKQEYANDASDGHVAVPCRARGTEHAHTML
jgi:hypothetical protein